MKSSIFVRIQVRQYNCGILAPATVPRTLDQTFRVGVVGSGPAGFYTTQRIIATVPAAKIDIFEALPVPYGLVRFGVAPDHPEVKNCRERFESIALDPRVTYIGNVTVGRPAQNFIQGAINLSSMRRHYDAIVFAYGATQDKELGIPGELTLRGIYSARQFVGWYNGHPEHIGIKPNLDGEEAVIIGHGNVALDVARILLSNVDDLRTTDITEEALTQLSQSRIRRVHVVGRRGPMQASFTIKEIRDLFRLPGIRFLPLDYTLVPKETKGLPRPIRRLMDVLLRGRSEKVIGAHKGLAPSWSLDFCLSPRSFEGTLDGRLRSTVFTRTILDNPYDPVSRQRPTAETVEIASSIVLKSTGYKALPLEEFSDIGIGFDSSRGVIRNDGAGRVLSGPDLGSHPVPGVYCTGWVKNGPTGVIASTMQDAFATGVVISHDWLKGAPFLDGYKGNIKRGWEGVKHELSNLKAARIVSWNDWMLLDQAERSRGLKQGKERVKFTKVDDMLNFLG